MLLYSANFALLLSHLYGWILKWFYRPKAYRKQFRQLFPAQRSVGALYLLQVLEVPYLLQIGDADALLYVNAFTLLVFSMQMLVMCEGYFFPEVKHRVRDYLVFLPAVLIVLPLLLQALHVITLPPGHRPWVFGLVTVLFVFYFGLTLRMAARIRRAAREINEAVYADSSDFPVRFAYYIQWLPSIVCLLLIANFYADDAVVKAVRDIVFVFLNIWFCIFTLNPWRKVFTPREEEIMEQMRQENGFRLTEERCEELRCQLDELLIRDHVFIEPHITLDTLTHRLGTNANYLSEVIRRSGYQSFYDMICQHRVRHAISLIYQHPDEKMLVIAERCGFTSQASMAKAFKAQGKEPPSRYRRHR